MQNIPQPPFGFSLIGSDEIRLSYGGPAIGRLIDFLTISLPVDGSSPIMRRLNVLSGTLCFDGPNIVSAGLDYRLLRAIAP